MSKRDSGYELTTRDVVASDVIMPIEIELAEHAAVIRAWLSAPIERSR